MSTVHPFDLAIVGVVVFDTEQCETCSGTLLYHTSWLTFVSIQASRVVLACSYGETQCQILDSA
jgi:hypothetical protein